MQPKSADQTRVEVLLRAADRDTETAETLVRYPPHLYESGGFSRQQLVEKYAKAALIANGLPAPFIYVLVKLLLPLVQVPIITLDGAGMDSAAILQSFALE